MHSPVTAEVERHTPDLNSQALAVPAAGGPAHIFMRLADWCAVPPYPGQRDTEGRLKRALRHLSHRLETHAQVAMGVLPDGRRFMLDGHTRALAWQRKLIPRPAAVSVTVYRVRDAEHARALYHAFDSPQAAERAHDVVHGALNESGVLSQLHTPFLRSGHYLRALQMASGLDRQRAVDAVKFYGRALVMLDSIHAHRKLFPSFILATALMDLSVQDAAGLAFWGTYNARQGTKTRNGYDGPELLHLLVLNQTKRAMSDRDTHLCQKALWIVTAYRRDPTRRWKSLPSDSIPLRQYAERHGLPCGVHTCLS